MELLINTGSPININDNSGMSPLHFAATKGNFKTIILAKSCNRMHFFSGRDRVVQVLLGNGIIVNSVDHFGANALHKAAYGGKFWD